MYLMDLNHTKYRYIKSWKCGTPLLSLEFKLPNSVNILKITFMDAHKTTNYSYHTENNT